MSDRIKHIKEMLLCAVESQIANLEEVDANELGEVVDMIKDLEEAEYYCAVVKAMEEAEEYEDKNMMYYGGRRMPEGPMTDWRDERRYYDGMSRHGSPSHSGNSGGHTGNGTSYYSEKEFPHAFDDPREGRSYRARRMYMESKETHQDKTQQMKELEKYAQELTQDIIDMIEDASPEEKQYMGKKITALANKITQLNTNG